MRVAVCARRRERLDRLAAQIASVGGEAAVYGVDVTDAGAVRAMVDDVASRWGRIDVLVNNAGRGLSATVEDTKPDEFRALLELNVMAVFTATQAVLPWMRRQGRGHIVNVSSIVGRRGVPYRGAYSATEFALGGFSEALPGGARGHGYLGQPGVPDRHGDGVPRGRDASRRDPTAPSSRRSTSPGASSAASGGRARRSIPSGRRGSSRSRA